MQRKVSTVEEMFQLGFSFGESWNGLGMVALIGTMGAGKTHFSKGFARGLGIQEEVTSPTFSLVQEYRSGRVPLFHFDWHRIKSMNEILDFGWDEYSDEGILLVEWADLFPQLWLDHLTIITINIIENQRIVDISKR